MGLGGGVWTGQDKILPGAYINFVAAARPGSGIGERGVVALPMALDWGAVGEVVTVTQQEFYRYAERLFGYTYDAPQMINLREVFKNALKVLVYRLANGAMAASNDYATAKYPGARGNDIKIVVAPNIDLANQFDVSTVVGKKIVDTQTIQAASGLIANDWVVFDPEAPLTPTAGTPLTGGSNGDAPTGAEYQGALDAFENCYFNVLALPIEEDAYTQSVKSVYTAYTRRLRDEEGIKFQLVCYRYAEADYEAVASVENAVVGTNPAAAVYWTAGALSNAAVNTSLSNTPYNGEYEVGTAYTQFQLEEGILAGKFLFHKVGDEVRVLTDINTLTTITEGKNEDFKSNQTCRIIDEIGTSIARIFNNDFFGKVPNDSAGRVALWSRIVEHHKTLETMRALENFNPDDVAVAAGESKKSVVVNDAITVVGIMEKLYMTVVVQ
ncbi:MAG: phage tail sheath family protein [Clostridiales Family XIII bacterium]|jgi:hypothetical protein|nr:phage tail sheath family protein [Clostridiales Family XIII bacterium]